jgi:hypothetical protein
VNKPRKICEKAVRISNKRTFEKPWGIVTLAMPLKKCKSPGWPQGQQRICPRRYSVVKKTEKTPEGKKKIKMVRIEFVWYNGSQR